MRANHNSPLVKRNFVLGIINGGIFQGGLALLSPETVMAAFAFTMVGGDKIWLGVISACIASGFSWPQIFLGRFYSTRTRLLPYYWLSGSLRVLSIVALAVFVAFSADTPGTLVFIVVAVLLFLVSSTAAIGIIPFMTIVSDSMPASFRGRFFGMRWLGGGLLGMVAGVVVKWVLSDTSGLTYPYNYVWLFGAAAVVLTIGVGVFSLVKEPPHATQSHQLTLSQELVRGPRLIRRDADWRILLGARASSAIAAGMSIPYLVPFALEHLEAPENLVGMLLTVTAASSAAANLFWSQVGDKRGNRALLMVTAGMAVAPSAIALLCYVVPDVPLGVWFGIPMTSRLALIVLAFIPMGCSRGGFAMGQTNFLLDIAPTRRRSTYLAYTFVILAPLAWWPIVGALVIGEDRFGLAFACATMAALVTLYLVSRLHEPRAAELGLDDDDGSPAEDANDDLAAGGE